MLLTMRTPVQRKRWGDSELTLVSRKTNLRHPDDCICAVCLYDVYAKSKKRPGHPWSRGLFFVAWLYHEAKMEALIKNGRIQELNKYANGTRLLIYRIKDYDRISARRTVTVYIKANDPDLLDLLPVYSQRIKSEKFRSILKSIFENKIRAQPIEKFSGLEPSDGLKLSMKIRDFVLSRPGKRATRREVQRGCGMPTIAEIDKAVEWLERFGIYRQQIAHKFQHKHGGYRNKQTVVYAEKNAKT